MELVSLDRKSPVLSHPDLPCLSAQYTINLTAGCVAGCRYCYAQGYTTSPGLGRVVFYRNSLDLLRHELPRKRVRPRLVYFSSACEPFAPFASVLDALYVAMELLLNHGVSLTVSTKARIPDRFVRLFERWPGHVLVQIGITTSDDRVRKIIEPHAAPARVRLDNARRLSTRGVLVEARMDPLLPDVTDSDAVLNTLFEEQEQAGVRRAVASYAFVRSSNRAPLTEALARFGVRLSDLYRERYDDYCGHSSILLPSRAYRRQKYEQLFALAREHGIAVKSCACKNPGLTSDQCTHDATEMDHPAVQPALPF